MNGTRTDQELMMLIVNKDADALKFLYDKYEKPIYAFAYRIVQDAMMAEEVVQELFLRIWKAAERYDAAHGKLTSWMFALTRNIAIDLLRKKQNRTIVQTMEAEQLNQIPDSGKSTEEVALEGWRGREIREALHELNPDQKQVVDLIYYQGYTQQEVSDQQAIPLGTVKSRVRLALKQLRGRLAGVGKEEVQR
ncbi:RNA polymerase sigma factor [Paenibacillus chondroitinus]|uniref:RNA polymerase sigma factor n=1 Tax=Paenibacillus chondroitinus TaxID=59842 RepID=A0ABU6D9D6_9BACL|nr:MULTISPECIES: RNA polymerase sigma factor [Paenibacillus]MCY9661826.1 RNA polymerase sigma factor [Paenibacillus anseongense]MEB4793912.1 RNA polymerase sigma factor [Paenibacillus chondroitinus]